MRQKILLKALTQRTEAKVEAINFFKEDQYALMKGRGTRDAIGLLRLSEKRSLQHNKDLFVCFVKYENAFDQANWSKLFETLKNIGAHKRDRE